MDTTLSNSSRLDDEYLRKQILADKNDYDATLISSQMVLGPEIGQYITPFAEKIVTNANDKTLSADVNVKHTMDSLLNGIADAEIAKYIMGKLSIDQMRTLIPNFNELIVRLKRTNKKFTKDTFYSWIISFLKELNQEVSITGSLPSSSSSSSTSIVPKMPIGIAKPYTEDFKSELAKALLERTPAKIDKSLELIDELEKTHAPGYSKIISDAKKRRIEDKALIEDARDHVKGEKMTKAREEDKKLFNEQMRKYKEEEEKFRILKEEEANMWREDNQMHKEDVYMQHLNAEEKHIDKIIKEEKVKLRKLKSAEFYDYIKTNYGITGNKPKGKLDTNRNKFISESLADNVRKQYINDKRGNNSVEGKGIGIKIQLRKPIKKRIITGKGISSEAKPVERYLQINDVHKIDMLKLNQEIPLLHCLYLAQKSKPLNKLSNVKISKDCVDVVKNMVNAKFNQKEYSLLPLEERRIIQQFNKQCKFNLNIPDKDNDEAVNNFNMSYGEFKSGNNNKDLLIKLKKQVILFMNEKLISQKDGNSILLQIALS